MRQTENRWNCWAQRTAVGRLLVKDQCWSQYCELFANDLDDGIEITLSKLRDWTEWMIQMVVQPFRGTG